MDYCSCLEDSATTFNFSSFNVNYHDYLYPNCAVSPNASAGQYATSNSKLLLFGFPCKFNFSSFNFKYHDYRYANCAAPPTASAGHYATSNCKPLLFGFPCKFHFSSFNVNYHELLNTPVEEGVGSVILRQLKYTMSVGTITMNSLSVLAIVFSHHAMSANIRFLCSLALSDLLCGICAFLDDASVASILTCISVAVWPSFSPMCGQHSDLFSIWPCSIQILAPCAQLKQVRFSKTDGKNKRRWTEWRRIESNGTNISDMSGHQQAVNHWNK